MRILLLAGSVGLVSQNTTEETASRQIQASNVLATKSHKIICDEKGETNTVTTSTQTAIKEPKMRDGTNLKLPLDTHK